MVGRSRTEMGPRLILTRETIDRFDGEFSHAILHTISMDGFLLSLVVCGKLLADWHWPQFINRVRHTNWPMDGYLKMSLGNQWPSLPYLDLCAV